MVRLRSSGEIAPGRYRLSCRFSGILNDRLCGFYRSTFVDDSGTEHTLATTQFEETDARRAFPCYDEPALKAIFSVTLDVPAGLLAASRTARRSPSSRSSRRCTAHPFRRHHRDVDLSRRLHRRSARGHRADRRRRHPAQGHPRPGQVAPHRRRPRLGGRHAPARFYTDYFGIAYPGEKLDLIAIPDFAAGAMENLGCVTFREAILLADPDNTSRAELERLAEVVEHEIAHMWFGDLVTMRWWNGIWLNEAFATFMALCCQDDYRPEWQTFVGFSRDKGSALGVDGLHATRPIEFPVRRPEEGRGECSMCSPMRKARRGAVDARDLPRARALPRWCPALPRGAPIRQHRDDRPVGRDRGRSRW